MVVLIVVVRVMHYSQRRLVRCEVGDMLDPHPRREPKSLSPSFHLTGAPAGLPRFKTGHGLVVRTSSIRKTFLAEGMSATLNIADTSNLHCSF